MYHLTHEIDGLNTFNPVINSMEKKLFGLVTRHTVFKPDHEVNGNHM